MAAPARHARNALAERLKELRRSTSLTGAEFAQRLGAGWAQPKVSRIETGRQLPTAGEIEAWAAATRADLGDLMAMHQRAAVEYATFQDRFAEPGGAAQLQDAIGSAEVAAKRIGQYCPAPVLGILQTADYAREMLHLEGGPATHGATEDDIDRMIAARLRRQAILHEPGRQITLIISEAALRVRVASPAAMQAQAEHIGHLAGSLKSAVIGIIPFTAQMPVMAMTNWVILDDLVVIETEGGDLELADPLEVDRYWRYTELLRDVSVTGAEAAELCRRIAGEIDA